MHVDYFQIGAHVGPSTQDILFKMDIKHKTLVLIEPVPYLFNKLKENYTQKCNNNTIFFKDIAVSNKDGVIQLYVPSPNNNWSLNPPWASQLASVNEDHIRKHLPNLIVDMVQIPCYRLNTLINDMSIRTIDTLMIDTEGHDYDILMDFDLNILKPRTIIFENKHMDGTFRRGEKYNGLMQHFISNGYKKVEEDTENTTIKLIE